MGVAMRRRLKSFLPIVLFALAVQVFAPIGACWAAIIAASDPLAGAVICHGNAAPGSAQSDQTGPHSAHNGCCSVCSVLYTGAPVDTPQAALAFTFDRQVRAGSLARVLARPGRFPHRLSGASPRAARYFLT